MKDTQSGQKTTKNKLAVICSQFPEMHETFVIRELAALKNAGIDLTIYSLKDCRDPIRHQAAEALKENTVYVPWDRPRTWWLWILGFFSAPLRSISALSWIFKHEDKRPYGFLKSAIAWKQGMGISRLMRKAGVTHIHAHWATVPTTTAFVAAHILDIPFSFTAHAWDIFVKNPSLEEKVRRASAVITCTDFNRKHLSKMVPDAAQKIYLNYHGVRIPGIEQNTQNTGSPGLKTDGHKWNIGEPQGYDERPLFLSVGRFVEQKGYEYLIAAYETLKIRKIEFRAVIVGTGPLRTDIENAVRQKGLTGHVTFIDRMKQEELKQLYFEADTFVLPCVVSEDGDRDGIPNVILEAMAYGLPIVSTGVSGLPEALLDQRTGLRVSDRDSSQLASALELIIRNPELRDSMGKRAREYAIEKFDEKIHMKKLCDLMKNIMKDGK